MIFGMVKEGILEILDEWLNAFRYEMVALVVTRSLTFREFRASGASDYHRSKEPIASRRWLVYVSNAISTGSFPEGGKGYTFPLSSKGQGTRLVGGGQMCSW